MPVVKIRRDEMEIVQQAVTRVERRSNFKFVMDRDRVEITDDGCKPKIEAEADDPQPPVVCD
jgi:hypothetical protein